MEGDLRVTLLFHLPETGEGTLLGNGAPCHTARASARSRLGVVEPRTVLPSPERENQGEIMASQQKRHQSTLLSVHACSQLQQGCTQHQPSLPPSN